jgi:hypothetical protein
VLFLLSGGSLKNGANPVKKPVVERPFQAWLREVQTVLDSFGMPLKAWQARWQVNFEREYEERTTSQRAAEKANRFWCRKKFAKSRLSFSSFFVQHSHTTIGFQPSLRSFRRLRISRW